MSKNLSRWPGGRAAQSSRRSRAHVAASARRSGRTPTRPCVSVTAQDSRLNELSYFALAQAAFDAHAIPVPTDPSEFAHHLPQVITLWTEGHLPGVPESFDAFAARITDVP